MKTINVILLVAIVFLINGCNGTKKNEDKAINNTALSQEKFNPSDEGYDLAWEDNFDGTELDTTKFKLRQIGPRRIGYNTSEAVSVSNGNLNLLYDIRGDSLHSSAIGSQGLFETRYGYFECRAQLQKSDGPWAAFWLQSPEISQGEDPAKYGAEIDIFEYFKKYGQDTLTHAIHWAYGPNMVSVGPMKSGLKGLNEGYHTFALEWTPEKYSFFIDSLKYHEQTVGLSHIDQYIILSMELPEKLEGIKRAFAPDTFFVDYVKVYKKKK
ncbi:MAG TPA: hypothetical protein DDZ96_08715 [Porphyromonadaceae bacterium]|jgi:beta-glucanase (GH16 family)|nr:hypothetical protein [Porphyromonadaceae bacterium]HBL33886.1 hypothetical protein [Porphyromonadaceae bacterium]HBX18839.1 hypothetical protein [Porphyromonadaceae bacterium]HCM20566.1 hypothetical protein [Porphyromonadaceae bacterium]